MRVPPKFPILPSNSKLITNLSLFPPSVPNSVMYVILNVFVFLPLVWSVTEQTLPPETAASSSDQARNKPRNNQQDQRRVHLSWRHNTWSETRSLCLLNSFERALPNAASSLCFLQCCTVRLPGAAAVVFFISLVDHFLSLFFFNTSNFHPLKLVLKKKNQQILLKVQY
jgi:hypothetical protein